MTLVIDRTIAKPTAATPPVVSVNGVFISRDAIAQEIQNHPAPAPMLARQQATRALVVRELLLQEARRLGLAAVVRADDADRRETEDEALVRALIESEIVTPEPDDDECRRYYENNMARFRSADVYEAAHILFAARKEEEAEFAESHRRAEAVLSELRLHPERFGDLAQTYSDCPSGATDGNLGQITDGQTTPEFEQAIKSLEPGQLCENPVSTRYGVHVVRLDRKIDGKQLPYHLVADSIADYLREAVSRRATAQYIGQLVSRADIAGIAI
jgi:peptidyl-prolyl cis-trans isomerase C